MKKLLLILLLLSLGPIPIFAKNYSLFSPSGNIELSISDENGNINISIVSGEKIILSPSPISLDINGSKELSSSVKKVKTSKDIKEVIKAPFHHTSTIDIIYNQLLLTLNNGTSIEFRAFNDGIAYRFITSDKNSAIVSGEVMDLNFPSDPIVYLSHSTNKENPMAMAFQNFYTVTNLSSASPLPAFLPVTIDYSDGLKMTILESDVESYPGMFIEADSISGSLKAVLPKYPKDFDYKPRRKQQVVTSNENYLVNTKGSRTFPWRIFAITDDDTKMPVNNLVYALASPSRIEDVSWIKPGKAAWEWWNNWGLRNVPFYAGINNDTYKYFIDFASENGLDYVVLDEGWYEPASGDMLTTIPELDLPMLIKYADEKGVGLWLWTVFNVLDDQLEAACEKYSEMGIKGLKVDFLDRNDAEAVEMTYRIADAAARHGLMLDLHGFYTPTGLNRTYPNIVNYESVFGMEELKWSDPSVDMPEYDVTFPFIRMMAGPVDFTPGAMLNRSKSDWKAIYSTPMSQGTRSHQIAHYIVHDSPFSMLADSPSNYLDNPESLEFISRIPSVWDNTVILDGKLGEYIVSLGKSGENFFIAGQTDWNPRDYVLDFSFLPKGQYYKVALISDGVNAERQAEDHIWETFTVNSDSKKNIHMAPGGGFALRVEPTNVSHGYPIDPVPFTSVKVNDNFWGQRLKASREVTIPLAFSKCEETGRYDNFVKAAHPSDTIHIGGFSFDDTDVYKTIEGASYLLQTYPDPRLEAYIDSVLVIVAAAQEPDGYLYTARTKNPEHPHDWAGSKRWETVENLSHEFYNLGHMIEGAVAHYQATGKRNFLDIAIKYADCICREIGDNPGQVERVPGHQIAEMALAKLYLVTGDKKYLDQAKYFLDKRGYTSRKDKYSQAHMPVVDQDEAVGHAVRAVYMYSGMADVAALTGDSAYIKAIDRIWDNIVGKKYYITGGIGATSNGEAFGENYELPNLTSYCETCAAIGNVYVNHRLFLLHGDSKYYDVLERTLYNGLISGVALDGGSFFYPNPLESHGEHERQAWFGCACCPSNISRFIPSLPGYVYAIKGDDIYVNLYMSNTSKLDVKGKEVRLSQETNYPWNGDVAITVDENNAGKFDLKLRIPGWVNNKPVPSDLYTYTDGKKLGYTVKVNGHPAHGKLTSDGYFSIDRNWKNGDKIELHLDMEPRTVQADYRVEADRGRIAVERGPVVYCAEWPDNDFNILNAQLSQDPQFEIEFKPEMLEGIVELITDAQLTHPENTEKTVENVSLTLIPYYSWAHRGKGNMVVWFPQK